MDGDELIRIHSALHLIFHRNRNQHGRTKWWKWLSILKRTTWNLAMFSSSSDESDSRPSAELWRRYLADWIIPRSYVAFSVVVADAQFSTLGTVLLATLAQLLKATGADSELKSRPQGQPSHEVINSPYTRPLKREEDMGESLPRTAGLPDIVQSSASKKSSRPTSACIARTTQSNYKVAKTSNAAQPKKRIKKEKKERKGKNAIDDLFDSLL